MMTFKAGLPDSKIRYSHIVLGAFVVISIGLIASCHQKNKDYIPPKAGTTLTENTGNFPTTGNSSIQKSFPSAKTFPSNGKWINPDLVTRPRTEPAGQPKVISPSINVHPAGTPKIVLKPQEAEIITPGENGIPLPKVKKANGRVAPALQPKPVPALSPDMENNAIANIQYLGVLQGMSSDFVHTLLEDRKGNLWFGTGGGGLSRYDGKSFIHYSEQEGLLYSIGNIIMEDRKHNLWLGTNTGVTMYDGEKFTHFTAKEGFSDAVVEAMLEDTKGNLWFGTRMYELIKYDGQYFTHFLPKEGIASNFELSLMEDRSGHIWFGTPNDGAFKFDGHHFEHYTTAEGLSSNNITSMLEDKNGKIWFGTDDAGICCLAEGKFFHYTTQEGLSHNDVVKILEDKEGNLWIGTLGGGLNKFDGHNFIHYTTKEGLVNDMLIDLIEDDKENIWCATYGGGVAVLKKHSFNNFVDHEAPSMEDSKGNLLNNMKGELKIFDYGMYPVTRYPTLNNRTIDTFRLSRASSLIMEDSQGNIWMGMPQLGVKKYDGQNSTAFTIKEGLTDNVVTAIYEDSKGQIWIGTENGINRYDGNSFTHFTKKEGLANESASSILEDSQGNIWIANNGGGVSIYDGKTFTIVSREEGLTTGKVWGSMLEDSQGNIWLSTWNGGVNIYDGEKITVVDKSDGLSNNIVYSTTEDRQGRFWVSTEQGLNLLIPEANTSPLSFQIITFGKRDGLRNLDIGTCFLDRNNRLWCRHSMLDLNEFSLPSEPPRIQLNQIELEQTFIDYRRLSDTAYLHTIPFGNYINHSFDSVARFYNYPLNLELPHQINNLTFQFSGIDWSAPHKIKYQFFLEGLDQDWSAATTDNVVDYRGLPHGRYTFKVRAAGQSMRWSEPFQYSFRILPPWWLTWWAYLLYFAVIVGLILGIRKYEIRRMVYRSEALRLSEIDNMKSKLYSNITHEFRTPLTVIIGLTGQIKGYDKERNLISRNSKKLLHLINQMLDLSRFDHGSMTLDVHQADIISYLNYLTESFYSLAEEKEIKLTFFSEETSLLMDFDEVKLQQVVYNLLSNAIKFTVKGDKVVLHARKTNINHLSQLQLVVHDTGMGIAAEHLPKLFDRYYQVDDSRTRAAEGTGIGLALTKEYVELMGGKISVESTVGQGSKFLIFLPITNHAPLASTDEMKKGPGTQAYADMAVWKGELEDALPLINMKLDGEKPLLLIVEDNKDVVFYIFSIVKEDYQVEIAPNGRVGLEKAIEKVPDIIISDVMMPEMDGFTLTNKLKNDERTSHIPIILLTAKAGQEDRITGLQSGADAYLSKPFNKTEMLVRLEKLTALRQALQQRYANLEIPHTAKSPTPNLEEAFLQKLRHIVEDHLDDTAFTVPHFCRAVQMSQPQLYRKLMALTGKSPTHFIRYIRLRKAIELLQTTEMNISEIAWETGFNDPSYFARVFHQEFGKTPSEYRN